MSVDLKSDFANAIRKQLDRYPVWQPGAPFALGDYGVLRDKTLYKLGNIRKFGVAFSKESGNEAPFQFQSKGTSLVGSHVSGSIEPSGLVAPIQASFELLFNEEHGIFIRAQRSRVNQIKELREVALQLRQNNSWNFEWKFVTEVREVDPATIIMGSAAGTKLKLEGDADLLEQFDLGGLKVGAALSFTGEAAFQVIGVVGPIFLDLSYLPRLWRGDVRQAAAPIDELPEEPYARLSAQPYVADDDNDI